ncbi:hypothetical protein PIB30_099304, partial [Stylosanthes scabra]|nr:hypothetical protein [Stylosanthes scabra]
MRHCFLRKDWDTTGIETIQLAEANRGRSDVLLSTCKAYDAKRAVLSEDEDGAAMNLSLPWRASDLVSRLGREKGIGYPLSRPARRPKTVPEKTQNGTQ